MSRLMNYGPDWPPAPEADDRVSDRAHRAAYWAAARQRFVFGFRTVLIAVLLGLAGFAIVDSRFEPNRGEVTIIWNDPSPHPATVHSHP